MGGGMRTRGERDYVGMPGFAARLYDNLTSVRGVRRGFQQIAQFLAARVRTGNLLDVGTGPGWLLWEIGLANRAIHLYGVDISTAMVHLAQENLRDLGSVDLRVGNITATDYAEDFFDAVVSTGSFYNWDHPVAGLDEMFRILKPGKTAFIYETVTDHDHARLEAALAANLRGYGRIRTVLSRFFLHRQLAMAYSTDQIQALLARSRFALSHHIVSLELGGLPIYVRMELTKPA